jgi:hypothetical protein
MRARAARGWRKRACAALAALVALERWRVGARFLHRSGTAQEREWSPGPGVRVELRREARGSDVWDLLSPSKRRRSRQAGAARGCGVALESRRSAQEELRWRASARDAGTRWRRP